MSIFKEGDVCKLIGVPGDYTAVVGSVNSDGSLRFVGHPDVDFDSNSYYVVRTSKYSLYDNVSANITEITNTGNCQGCFAGFNNFPIEGFVAHKECNGTGFIYEPVPNEQQGLIEEIILNRSGFLYRIRTKDGKLYLVKSDEIND